MCVCVPLSSIEVIVSTVCVCVCAFDYLTSSQLSQPVSIYHWGLIQSGPTSQSELGWPPLPASHHATSQPCHAVRGTDRRRGREKKDGKGEREKERKEERSVNKVKEDEDKVR